MNNTFSIGDVAEQTGITEKQLRYWELRGFIKPQKMVSGKRYLRRYSEDQIRFIKAVKSQLDKGFTLQASIKMAQKNKETRGVEYEEKQ
jgi:DNA-binding transcriptional MerR regulator